MCTWCGDGKAHAAQRASEAGRAQNKDEREVNQVHGSVYEHMEFIALKLRNASSLSSSMCYHPLIFSYGFIFG